MRCRSSRALSCALLAALVASAAAAAAAAAAPSDPVDEQCNAEDGECGGGKAALQSASAAEEAAEGADASGKLPRAFPNGTLREPLKLADLGWWRIGIVLALLGGVVLWILCTIKFAIDGSLPARLAMWGFLPEAYAAISVRAVIALLRLKTNSTPIIVLRSCVTDDGAKELAEGIRQYGQKAELEALELPHNPRMGQEGIRALAAVAMLECQHLQELDLSYNPQLGDYVIQEMLPLLPSKASKLNTLKLADCGIGQAEVKQLAAGLKNSGLRTLDLSLNSLSGAGEILGIVCEAPILEEIILGCCGLSAEDVGEIAEQLPFTSIKSVQLGGNHFGLAGLAALAEHLPLCQVDELGLEANDLEEKDLSVLGVAWVKRPFSRVKLNGNHMTNEQISQFVATLKTMHA